jgi:hypothetical protein
MNHQDHSFDPSTKHKNEPIFAKIFSNFVKKWLYFLLHYLVFHKKIFFYCFREAKTLKNLIIWHLAVEVLICKLNAQK